MCDDGEKRAGSEGPLWCEGRWLAVGATYPALEEVKVSAIRVTRQAGALEGGIGSIVDCR